MLKTVQKFDFEKAIEFEREIVGKITGIEAMFNQTLQNVRQLSEWWRGGSERQFLASFENTKKRTVKDLESWLDDYRKRMQEVRVMMQEDEEKIKASVMGTAVASVGLRKGNNISLGGVPRYAFNRPDTVVAMRGQSILDSFFRTFLVKGNSPTPVVQPPPDKRGPYIPPPNYSPPPQQWNMAPGSIPLPPGYVHPPFSPRRTFFETRIIEQFEYNWLEVSEHVTIEFLSRITEISKSLQINPDHLMHVIDFETGGTFSPSQRNIWGSGATGLIKFMPETAEFLGTTTDALTNMSAVEQLDFVYEHLKPHSGNMNTLNDVYMAVLWPIAVGRSDDSVLWREGSGQYTANSSLDLNGDGVITKAEATQRVINHRNDFNRIERLG